MDVQEQTEEVAAEQPSGRGRNHRGDSNNHASSGNTLVLGPRDSLVGRLTIDGDVRILGTLEGELSASGDVEVEPKATVKASVEGRNVNVRGDVTGDLTAREKLVLAGSGVLNGNVKVARLAIEDGATLNGNVTMQRGE